MPSRRQLGHATAGALAYMAVPPLAFAEGDRWISLAPMPTASQEIYPTAWEGAIWTAGGIASGLLTPFISDRVEIYQPGTDTWSAGPSLPEARHHVTLLAGAEHLFAIGGYFGSITGGIWQIRDTVWRLRDNRWQPTAPLPEGRAEMTSAVIHGALHLVGGRVRQSPGSSRNNYRDTADHLLLPPGETQWQRAHPASVARNSAAGGFLAGRLYVTGGRNDSGNLTLTEAWDPTTDTWETCAPLPQAQAGLGGAVLGDHLYVFGGEVFSPQAGVFAEGWRYDPAADRWDALAPMKTPRHGLGAVAIGGHLYAVGGATQPGGNGRSKALERLTPAGPA